MRIAIIENDENYRSQLKKVIEEKGTHEVVAEGSQNMQVYRIFLAHSPNVVLMNLDYCFQNTIETIEYLMQMYPKARVIVYSASGDEDYIKESIRVGVKGFVCKSHDFTNLFNALNSIENDLVYIDPSRTLTLLQAYQRLNKKFQGPIVTKTKTKPYDIISKKEFDVLKLLASGFTNKMIAENMVISEKTVKNHVSRLLSKLQVEHRTQAAVLAIKKGWVEII